MKLAAKPSSVANVAASSSDFISLLSKDLISLAPGRGEGACKYPGTHSNAQSIWRSSTMEAI
jgi:hypothetical protein